MIIWFVKLGKCIVYLGNSCSLQLWNSYCCFSQFPVMAKEYSAKDVHIGNLILSEGMKVSQIDM